MCRLTFEILSLLIHIQFRDEGAHSNIRVKLWTCQSFPSKPNKQQSHSQNVLPSVDSTGPVTKIVIFGGFYSADVVVEQKQWVQEMPQFVHEVV